MRKTQASELTTANTDAAALQTTSDNLRKIGARELADGYQIAARDLKLTIQKVGG